MKTNWLTAGLVGLMLTVGATADENEKPHTLPADGKTAVITMDFKGGMIQRKGPDPVLTVNADGTVIVGDTWGGGRRVEGKISADELRSLLRVVLDQWQFAQITPNDLKLRGNMKVSDATTVSISVQADGAKYTASASAVEEVIKQLGPASVATHFLAIQHRLDQLCYVTILGGDEGVRKDLELANAALSKRYPGEPALQPADLLMAMAQDHGTTATFQKRVNANGMWHMVDVVVTHEGDAPPKVKASRGMDQEMRFGSAA